MEKINRLEEKRNSIYYFLIFACAFLWIMMMGSKNVYIAEIEVIMGVFNITEKATASFAMTLYFITYAIIQIVLFFIISKLSIKWYILFTIVLSGIVTVIVAFATSTWHLWALLSLNGLLQGGVWAFCVTTFKKYLPIKLLPFANTVMNTGTAVAGIISYGTPAIFVKYSRWDMPFIILGIILSLSAVLFFISVVLASKLPKENEEQEHEEEQQQALFLLDTKKKSLAFIVVTFIISILTHFLFYPVMNWMPSLLIDEKVFGLPDSVSILITVLAPIATVVGPIFAVRHCEKHKNFLSVTIIYLIISAALMLLISLFFDFNLILSIVLIIAYLVVVQGAMTIVFSVVPLKMSAFINAGAIGGLLNAAGAVSAGFAPTIIGAVIDNAGWQISYLVLLALNVFLVLSLILILSLLKRKKALL